MNPRRVHFKLKSTHKLITKSLNLTMMTLSVLYSNNISSFNVAKENFSTSRRLTFHLQSGVDRKAAPSPHQPRHPLSHKQTQNCETQFLIINIYLKLLLFSSPALTLFRLFRKFSTQKFDKLESHEIWNFPIIKNRKRK